MGAVLLMSGAINWDMNLDGILAGGCDDTCQAERRLEAESDERNKTKLTIAGAASLGIGIGFAIAAMSKSHHLSNREKEAIRRYKLSRTDRPRVLPRSAAAPTLGARGDAFQIPLLSGRF